MPALFRYIPYWLLPVLLFQGGIPLSASPVAPDTAQVLLMIDAGYAALARSPDSARCIYDRALRESRSIRFTRGEIAALRGIGVMYAGLGLYDSSLAVSRQALDLALSNMPGSNEVVYLYNNIASVYVNFGDLKEAAAYYFKVLDITRQSGNIPGRVQALNNLSEVFGNMGDNARGLDCIAQALAIAPQSSYGRDMIPFLYINQAGLLSGAGREQEAILAAGKALRLNDAGKQQYIVRVEASLTLGDIFLKMSHKQDAEQAYTSALQASDAYPLGRERALLSLGKLYRQQQRYTEAIAHLEQAIPLAKASHSMRELAATLEQLANCQAALALYREASTNYQQAARLKDSLNTVENNRNISLIEYKYRTAVKDRELAQKQLTLLRQGQQLTRKNWTIAAISAGCLTLVLLLFFILRSFRQRMSLERQEGEIKAWRATLEGEEKERRRLARELHDNIGGTLSNVRMWLGAIQEQHSILRNEPEYNGAMQLLEQTLTEVRDTAHHLMPELLLRLGLAEAAQVFCRNVQKASGLPVNFIYLGYIGKLEPHVELLLYRSIQELIQNAVRHAKATTVLVQLAGTEDMISITVEDDGMGMDTGPAASHDGMGLQGIRKGIEHIGGEFRLESGSGKGTVINMDISL